MNGETISATPSHPFYVPKFGWTKAINLRAGDILVLSNGEYVIVEAIQHEILESPIKVYNFEVEDFHIFFVGECGALVHNDCPEWVKKKRDEGNQFNKENRGNYKYNEVEVKGSKPGDENRVFRLDSYNPGEEIVSRKYTQFADIQESTGKGYLSEFTRKYSDGAIITDSPFNPKDLRGQALKGNLILEVPVQNNPVPQAIIDDARRRGITIRDVKGVIYT